MRLPANIRILSYRSMDDYGYAETSYHFFRNYIRSIDQDVVDIFATQDAQNAFVQIHDRQIHATVAVSYRVVVHTYNYIVSKLSRALVYKNHQKSYKILI